MCQINEYLKNNLDKMARVKVFYDIGKNTPFSDAFINKLAELNNRIPNMEEFRRFLTGGIRLRNKYYENLDMMKEREHFWGKNMSVVKDLMNNEYSKWPIYKPPESAAEGFTPSENAMMEKDVKEPKGYDITTDKGSNEFMGD